MILSVLVLGNASGAFLGNLGIMLACVANGLVVTHAAPAVHQMHGWRRRVSSAGLGLLVLTTLGAVGQPQLVKATLVFAQDCVCYWGWESWCCYF